MAYDTAEARQQMLDTIAEATDEIGLALASLGNAYEQLDERAAGELEDQLFGPVQAAYGRAQRGHSEFAARHGLPTRAFEPQPAGPASTGARGFVDAASEAAGEADAILSELQDSLLPVEVGDRELRARLSEVRELLADVRPRARRLIGTLGR
jgi:hypothetical protein